MIARNGAAMPAHRQHPNLMRGNPNHGRQRLTRGFFNDLALHWEAEGGDVIQRVIRDDPATFLRVIASLMPKDVHLQGDNLKTVVIDFRGVVDSMADPVIDSLAEREAAMDEEDED